jgi:hypothetical protein
MKGHDTLDDDGRTVIEHAGGWRAHSQTLKRLRLTIMISTLALISPVVISAATAQSIADARTMPCTALQSLVSRNGSAVIQTRPSVSDTYEVTGCPLHKGEQPAYLPARDNPQCFVGYTCRPDWVG